MFYNANWRKIVSHGLFCDFHLIYIQQMNQIFGTLSYTILKILDIPYPNVVRGIWRFKLFSFKIKKVAMCDNIYTHQIQNETDNRTGGNLNSGYQNYLNSHYPYNYLWYPVYNWQNYYYNYNHYVHPISNYYSFNYVPHSMNYGSQYYPTSNTNGISRDGIYNFRRVNSQNGQSNSFEVENVMSLRLWEHINPQNRKPGFIFTLMSYNVLAQDLLENHPYLYRRHNPESLNWEIRWNNLLTEIKRLNPDIVCLQEVQESHITKYFKILESLGYSGIYKKRTGIRTDGCSIYYKEENVNLIDHAAVEFLNPEIPLLNRDNVGLVAKFSPKNHTSKEFVVATTHLLYNPRRSDVRLAQMQLFFSVIDRISYQRRFGKPSHIPVILTGDLNAQPNSELYKSIISGKISYGRFLQNTLKKNNDVSKLISTTSNNCHQDDKLEKKLDEVTVSNLDSRTCTVPDDGVTLSSDRVFLIDKFSFRSVYDHGYGENREGTTFQDEWLTVDYIFYSVQKEKDSEDKLKLLSRWRLPTKEELDGIFIPNRVFGSDHLSLIAKFKLEF